MHPLGFSLAIMPTLFLVLALLGFSLSTNVVRESLRNIPVPLIVAGANRHINEYKKKFGRGKKFDAPKFERKVPPYAEDVSFWDKPTHHGSLTTNEEYITHVVQLAVGP